LVLTQLHVIYGYIVIINMILTVNSPRRCTLYRYCCVLNQSCLVALLRDASTLTLHCNSRDFCFGAIGGITPCWYFGESDT